MAMKHWILYVMIGAMGLGCAEMSTQDAPPPTPAAVTPEAKPLVKPVAKPVPPPELVFPTGDLPEEKPAAPAKQESAGGVSISIGELEAIELVPIRASAATAIEKPVVAKKRPVPKEVQELLGEEEPTKPVAVAVVKPKPKPVAVVAAKSEPKPEPKPVAVVVVKPEPKAEPKPVAVVVVKPEPKPVAVVAVAKPEPKPEPKPVVVVVVEPEPKPEPKPVVVVAKPKPEPKPEPVAPKSDFEGHHLSVELDQQPTVADAKKTAYQQRWSVRRCGGTPSLFVTYDEKALGELESADVTIQPMANGKVTYTELWLYAGKGKLTIGKHWLLSPFRHIVRGKLAPEQPFLPSGEYLITVQVNGSKTWDRQYIRVTVK
jgi:hypothetical protein